jgi:MYXO-CTERM domain-containing protein
VKVTPSDWSNLAQSTAALEVDDGSDPDPDPDDNPATSGCGCHTRDGAHGLSWLLLAALLGLALRRRFGARANQGG